MKPTYDFDVALEDVGKEAVKSAAEELVRFWHRSRGVVPERHPGARLQGMAYEPQSLGSRAVPVASAHDW